MKQLEGKVTLVTGATRGIGKGIAIGLGEAGATVYVTGRSLNHSDSSNEVSGSLAETQSAVEEVGGVCIPVQVDHSDSEQVRLLFERIQDEQNGRLDLLVNNAYSGVQALRDAYGKPFWDCEPSLWDACNNVGLGSHYVASVFAAGMMTKRRSGLICTISSWMTSAFTGISADAIKLVFNVLRGLFLVYLGISLVRIVNAARNDEDWQNLARTPLIIAITVVIGDILSGLVTGGGGGGAI